MEYCNTPISPVALILSVPLDTPHDSGVEVTPIIFGVFEVVPVEGDKGILPECWADSHAGEKANKRLNKKCCIPANGFSVLAFDTNI